MLLSPLWIGLAVSSCFAVHCVFGSSEGNVTYTLPCSSSVSAPAHRERWSSAYARSLRYGRSSRHRQAILLSRFRAFVPTRASASLGPAWRRGLCQPNDGRGNTQSLAVPPSAPWSVSVISDCQLSIVPSICCSLAVVCSLAHVCLCVSLVTCHVTELVTEAGLPINCDAYVSLLSPDKAQMLRDQQDLEAVHTRLIIHVRHVDTWLLSDQT